MGGAPPMRDLQRPLALLRREDRCKPADFLIREIPFAPLTPVAPDAPTGTGPFGAQPHEFGLPEDDGQNQHGAVDGQGRGTEEVEP